MTKPTARRKKRRRSSTSTEPHPEAKKIAFAVFGFVFIFLALLWKAETALDEVHYRTSSSDLVRAAAAAGAAAASESQRRKKDDHAKVGTNAAKGRQGKSGGKVSDKDDDDDIVSGGAEKEAEEKLNAEEFAKYDKLSIEIAHRYRSLTKSFNYPTGPSPDKFVVFIPIGSGQGEGNIMAGLLAATLLGEEFNRIICVSPRYDTFLSVFEPIHPWAVEKCPTRLANLPERRPSGDDQNYVRLVTFEKPPDECRLQSLLRDGPDVIFIESNTYPRWPHVPQGFFFRFFRPKPTLLNTLPYSHDDEQQLLTGLETVVHLREGDQPADTRKGTDARSLDALGKLLPSNTYLVTNRVEWHDLFEKKFGWRHPNWDAVTHTALRKTWGVRGKKFVKAERDYGGFDRKKEMRQLWCDWYTILTAQTVYHSHSDFSISALHWNGNPNTWTLGSYNKSTKQLDMARESYIVDGETAPLVERRLDAEGTSQLRLCSDEQQQQQQK